jgi:hypothetical protein
VISVSLKLTNHIYWPAQRKFVAYYTLKLGGIILLPVYMEDRRNDLLSHAQQPMNEMIHVVVLHSNIVSGFIKRLRLTAEANREVID